MNKVYDRKYGFVFPFVVARVCVINFGFRNTRTFTEFKLVFAEVLSKLVNRTF